MKRDNFLKNENGSPETESLMWMSVFIIFLLAMLTMIKLKLDGTVKNSVDSFSEQSFRSQCDLRADGTVYRGNYITDLLESGPMSSLTTYQLQSGKYHVLCEPTDMGTSTVNGGSKGNVSTEAGFYTSSGLLDISWEEAGLGDYFTSGITSLIKKNKYAKVILPDTITDLPSYAFNGCNTLISITLSSNISSISSSAFEGCEKLRLITYKKVPYSTKESFLNILSREHIYVDEGLLNDTNLK